MEKISCKRCQSEESRKAGKMNCKQRYCCKDCGYHFTAEDGRVKYRANDRLAALTLYRKGLSLRSIAEIIGTSNVLILYWIRNIGRFVQETVLSRPFSSSEEMDIIEIDEMWHYVQKNAKEYGYGLLTLVPNKESLPVKSALVVLQH